MSRLLRKVLAGIGSYLVKEDEYNQQRARDQLLADREIALKQLEFAHEDQASARDHTERLDEITATGAESRRTALVTAQLADAKDTRSDERDLSKAITLKKLDMQGDQALAGIQHKYKISEAQAQSALDLQRSLAEAGQTVDRIVFTKDGRGVAYSKTSKRLGQTEAGVFNPSGTNGTGDDLGDYLNSGGASSGSGISRTQAQPTPKIKPDDDATARAAFANRYAQATPQNAPGLFRNGQRIPMDEAWNLYSGQ